MNRSKGAKSSVDEHEQLQNVIELRRRILPSGCVSVCLDGRCYIVRVWHLLPWVLLEARSIGWAKGRDREDTLVWKATSTSRQSQST